MARAERKKSPVNEAMLEVQGTTSIGDAPPPGIINYADVDLEELGQLSEFPSTLMLDDPEQGVGPWMVVLSDYLSGAGQFDDFTKGDVRRLSRIVKGYDDPDVSRDIVRARVKRLFELKAIRKAAPEEVGKVKVEVTRESESESVAQERNRRISAEAENERLREQLALANAGLVNASPNQADASLTAQKEAAGDGDESGKDPNWEDDED